MNKENDLVSVILPTYNRGGLLPRAIKSVLNQTYSKIETIIIDDGSTDNTEEIVKSINDKRIQYIRFSKNKGANFARNIGIKNARGKFISFQDSDNEWSPEKIEKQMDAFKLVNDEYGVVYCGFWRVKDEKMKYIPGEKIKNKEGDIHHELVYGNFIDTPAMLVKKECFNKSGLFDENLPKFQDWDMAIRLSKYYKFKFIDEALFYSYYTKDSITANFLNNSTALKILTEKYSSYFKSKKRIFSRYNFIIGKQNFNSKKIIEAKKYLLISFKYNPFNYKSLILLFIVKIKIIIVQIINNRNLSKNNVNDL